MYQGKPNVTSKRFQLEYTILRTLTFGVEKTPGLYIYCTCIFQYECKLTDSHFKRSIEEMDL